METGKIEKGMVFKDRDDPKIEYVVLDVFTDRLLLERITNREKGSVNRHVAFLKTYEMREPDRIMDEDELLRYISDDPAVNLECGIYMMLKDLVDINMKDLAPRKSIVNVINIECKKIPGCERHELYIGFQLFGVEGSRQATIVEASKDECIKVYLEMMKKIPL